MDVKAVLLFAIDILVRNYVLKGAMNFFCQNLVTFSKKKLVCQSDLRIANLPEWLRSLAKWLL